MHISPRRHQVAPATAAERPNILLILVDDLKPAIHAFGDPVAVTPNIDRLAARGTRFELRLCQSVGLRAKPA
jgi:iduronate 2-sulfatase